MMGNIKDPPHVNSVILDGIIVRFDIHQSRMTIENKSKSRDAHAPLAEIYLPVKLDDDQRVRVDDFITSKQDIDVFARAVGKLRYDAYGFYLECESLALY